MKIATRRNAPSTKLRVLLAEEHSLAREGLRCLIKSLPDMEVIGEVDNSKNVVKMIREKHPDLLLLTPYIPGQKGAEITRKARETDPLLRILILTSLEQAAYFKMHLKAGASGYVLNIAGSAELMRAISSVAAGSTYIDPLLAGTIFGQNGTRGRQKDLLENGLLTEREQEVLSLAARGYGNKEISGLLLLSIKTIETYKARSMERLGLTNRVELICFARHAGWLDCF